MNCHDGRWRLLVSGGGPAAHNMAVDEALMRSVADAPSPWSHTIRLYWFEPAALSIGANQPIGEVDLEACRTAGVDVVRRPTGGRAVLHDGELTYAVAGQADGIVFAGDIRASYR